MCGLTRSPVFVIMPRVGTIQCFKIIHQMYQQKPNSISEVDKFCTFANKDMKHDQEHREDD